MSTARGGLAETWAMAWATRARTAETPKQPSLSLMLRAPYFYPTPYGARADDDNETDSGSAYVFVRCGPDRTGLSRPSLRPVTQQQVTSLASRLRSRATRR